MLEEGDRSEKAWWQPCRTRGGSVAAGKRAYGPILVCSNQNPERHGKANNTQRLRLSMTLPEHCHCLDIRLGKRVDQGKATEQTRSAELGPARAPKEYTSSRAPIFAIDAQTLKSAHSEYCGCCFREGRSEHTRRR